MKKQLYVCFVLGSFVLLPCYSFSGTADFIKMKQGEEKKVTKEVFDEFAELDAKVDIAIIRGILKPEIEFEKPSNVELILRKIAIPFLNLYICSVLKFRALKGWAAKQWENRTNWKFYTLLFRKQKQKETSIE